MTFKIIGVMAILLVSMTAGFYWYYNNTQNKLAILHENAAKMEVARQIAEETISSLLLNQDKVNSELNKINNEFKVIRNQNSILAKKLAKHDLGVLAAAKPGLVVKIINRASDKSIRCFELLSGAELTAAEMAATSGKSFNSECPWLWGN